MDFIVDNYAPNLTVKRYKYKLGRTLAKGESSKGLYAIMSTSKNIVLRVSVIKEHAELLTQCDSRYLKEIFLEI